MNSIGQLLRHLAVVDLHWVYRLKNQQYTSSLQKEYGPLVDAAGQIPSIKDTTIIDLIDSYDKVQTMFRLECTKLSEEGLNNVVSYENGKTATIVGGYGI